MLAAQNQQESAADRPINDVVADELRAEVAHPDLRDTSRLYSLLRMLAKWRAQVIGHVLWKHSGGVIAGGPFAGMRYFDCGTNGATAPRLLGIYESELHPFIERFVAASFGHIAVVGSAEGYYAVGLALRSPSSAILTFDIDPAARDACSELAQMNDVAGRVTVNAAFTPELLPHPDQTFILCDVEGAEDELFDPVKYSMLCSVPALIVECHEGKRPGVTRKIGRAFMGSHRVQLVQHALTAPVLPAWLMRLGHLDQLLALWEWRQAPTPWLVMTRK
jgi:hypothetical protein